MAMPCPAPAAPARCKWLQTSQCPFFIIWKTHLPFSVFYFIFFSSVDLLVPVSSWSLIPQNS